MAILLRANGNTEELKADSLTLEKVWVLIEGYVERVICRPPMNNSVLYVSDEARISGMPFNHDASSVAGMTILGNAILLTKEEELLIK
jgi:hypothetical protein